MVLLHVSRGSHEFIHSTPTSSSVDSVSRDVAHILNMKCRLQRLAYNMRQLALYGPAAPEKERNKALTAPDAPLPTFHSSSLSSPSSSSPPSSDPLGVRLGPLPSSAAAATLNKAADEAEAICSNALAKQRRPLLLSSLSECLENARGAVMIAFPQGLIDEDPVRQGLEGTEELKGTQWEADVMDPDTCVLWFAGKNMERTQPLSKYTGNNEKVLIKVKVERRGASAPAREPAVDEETRKAMMSMWYKKEQESKKLEEADDDSYLNSSWANPSNYKQSILGMGEVKFKPGGR